MSKIDNNDCNTTGLLGNLSGSIAYSSLPRDMGGFDQPAGFARQKESPMKLAYLVLLTFLCFSCASKKMVAQNADIIIQAQIQKRLPLYSDQKEKLDKDVNTFLNEQKAFAREAIPVITSIELDVSKVDQKYDYLNSLYQKLALNFAQLMSKYMAPLDEKQQKDFEKTLKAENQSLIRSSPEDRMEKVNDRFETLFGTISDKQQKILAAQKGYFAERHKIRIIRREKLHDRFMEIYKMDVSQNTRSTYFYEAFAEYQKNYPENTKNKEIIKSIIPTLSPGQKEVFEDKINDLKEIINYYLEAHF